MTDLAASTLRHDFTKDITSKIEESLTVSKKEKDSFRFTGIDVLKTDQGITISMNDYANSLENMNNCDRNQMKS